MAVSKIVVRSTESEKVLSFLQAVLELVKKDEFKDSVKISIGRA